MNLHKFLPAICFYTLFTSCGNNTKQRDIVSENEKIFKEEDLLNQFHNQIMDGTISQDQISHFFEKYNNITAKDVVIGPDGKLSVHDYFDQDVYSDNEILAPYKLVKGDTICILEPARTNKRIRAKYDDMKDKITQEIERRGFKIEFIDDSFEVTAEDVWNTTAARRAQCFNEAIKNENFKAIFSFCGGYGAIQLLDKLDYEAIRANRKIFVGFSDETSIQLAMLKKSGLISFNGPMFGADITKNHENCQQGFDYLFKLISGEMGDKFELKNIDEDVAFSRKDSNNSTCEGRIVGGCLFLNQCSLGTPYLPSFENRIFFFEDDTSARFRVHRALEQLKLAGKFDKLAGVMIGALVADDVIFDKENIQNDREKRNSECNVRLGDCLNALMPKCSNIPVIANVHSGKLFNPITIPIGAMAKIEGTNVTIIESVVAEKP